MIAPDCVRKQKIAMILILDLGNTNQKAGVFDGDRLVRLENHKQLSVTIVRRLLGEFPEIAAGMVCSVVAFPAPVRDLLQKWLSCYLELASCTPVPLVNRYREPERLGMDRLAAAVAGSRMFPGIPVLVVNAGTCITCDLVSARAEYLGGAIAPGIAMRLRALHTFTSKLPLVPLEIPQALTGNSTRNSILSGTVIGAASEVEGMIRKFRRENPGLRVILSGGDREILVKHLKIRIFAVPEIVLTGLKHILEFNLHHAR